MKSFEKVIGYDGVKQELMQICDMIRNKEVYEKLGAKLPSGVLLAGKPGLGKTLMAKCFIEESGLKAYTVRKNKSDDFAAYISDRFAEAKENAPSIVFLDDMDKFANEDDDHPDADEYVAVQAGIDDVKGSGVFVLATVNNIYKLPNSLTRAGRFDRTICMENPTYEDCEKIIKYYLSKKTVSGKLQIEDIPKMINYSSCAVLETIVNEAAIHAAYERKEAIDTDDFIYAVLKLQYNSPDDCSCLSEAEVKERAYHEAGHAVISEILIPGSVGFISIRKNRSSGECGFVHRCKDITEVDQHILIALAGKAATEMFFGICDMGSENDIKKAVGVIRDLISDVGVGGMGMMNVVRRFCDDTSEIMNTRIEAATQAMLEEYMFKTKKILADNKEFIEKLAEALRKKECLLNSDIAKIRENIDVLKSVH